MRNGFVFVFLHSELCQRRAVLCEINSGLYKAPYVADDNTLLLKISCYRAASFYVGLLQ